MELIKFVKMIMLVSLMSFYFFFVCDMTNVIIFMTLSSSSSLTISSSCALGLNMETNGRKRRDFTECL
jgi:hypothetical protein